MDQSLVSVVPLLPPLAAIVVSVATFVLTQVRAQRIDDRAAARSTVDLLVEANRVLSAEVQALRVHVDALQAQLDGCQEERMRLLRKAPADST